MKVFALCCFLLVAGLAVVSCNLDDEEAKKVFEGCMAENGVDKRELKSIERGSVKKEDVKENVKCTVKCFMVKSGIMDDAGKFNAEAFKAVVAAKAKPELMEAVEKCKGLEGPNPCEKAFLIAFCMHEHKMEVMH